MDDSVVGIKSPSSATFSTPSSLHTSPRTLILPILSLFLSTHFVPLFCPSCHLFSSSRFVPSSCPSPHLVIFPPLPSPLPSSCPSCHFYSPPSHRSLLITKCPSFLSPLHIVSLPPVMQSGNGGFVTLACLCRCVRNHPTGLSSPTIFASGTSGGFTVV